jgi:hypothetical protein
MLTILRNLTRGICELAKFTGTQGEKS